MSRTIRCPNSNGWYRDKKEFDGKNKHWESIGYGIHWYIETWEEYTRNIHRDGANWNMSTPSWWIHDTSTIKERTKTRVNIQKVYKLIDYEDVEEFPLDKKPHEYYW